MPRVNAARRISRRAGEAGDEIQEGTVRVGDKQSANSGELSVVHTFGDVVARRLGNLCSNRICAARRQDDLVRAHDVGLIRLVHIVSDLKIARGKDDVIGVKLACQVDRKDYSLMKGSGLST